MSLHSVINYFGWWYPSQCLGHIYLLHQVGMRWWIVSFAWNVLVGFLIVSHRGFHGRSTGCCLSTRFCARVHQYPIAFLLAALSTRTLFPVFTSDSISLGFWWNFSAIPLWYNDFATSSHFCSSTPLMFWGSYFQEQTCRIRSWMMFLGRWRTLI